MRDDPGKQGKMYGDIAERLDDQLATLDGIVVEAAGDPCMSELHRRIEAVRPVTRDSDIEPIVAIVLESMLLLTTSIVLKVNDLAKGLAASPHA